MKKTKNFELNQWESTDRILMEDFNGDNRNTELGILSRLGPVEVIQQVMLDRSSQLSDAVIDLSGLNWDEWSFLAVEFSGIFSSNADKYTFYVNFPGVSFTGYPGPLAELAPKPSLIVLLPCRDGTRAIRMIAFPDGKLAISSQTYQALSQIDLAASYMNILGQMQGSASLTLYGIR